MKDDDTPKKEMDGSLFGKNRYKLWAVVAILLLAFWSMFAGTVTLKWSAGNLMRFSSDGFDGPIQDDLDVLEVEEREKVVRHMWDVYTHNKRIKLPRFWEDAFEAAYEELDSDSPDVRDSAISEIAKMSFRMLGLDHTAPRHTNSKSEGGKSKKEKNKGKSSASSSGAAKGRRRLR
ncbi:hypothetical protein EJ110_NYTH50100 [Nymphaea thermarum]|nr:hypothetical protein EJ110_NYTH50100 [Nymphaea thermarum]